jgi:creatinine amidohydrolase
MCDLLGARAPADMDLRILPVMAVGKSNEHLWAAGTLTLSAETALRAWTEVGLSVARAGVRKMVILNSHGGNVDLISIVSRELRVKAGMFVTRLGWGAFGAPEGMYSEQESKFGIHGGDVETSLILHFRPETVDMSAAQDFRSTAETGAISPIGPVAYGWISTDVNPHGVVGEAHLATAEKGRLTAEKMADDVIDFLRKVEAEPVDRFAPVDLAF